MPYKDYEKQKENARKNYYKNKEKRLKQAREYYYANWEEKQEYRAKWIKENPEKVRLAKKKYGQSHKGKAARDRAVKKWRKNNPEQLAANEALGNAVRCGKIYKPDVCSVCEKKGIIHGHHHRGYKKEFYLDVVWLCPQCHKNEHYENV